MLKTVIIVALLIVGLGAVLVATGGKGGQAKTDGQSEVTMQQLRSDVDGGGVLLDVRTPQEYAAGRIEGADNVPLQSIQSGTLPAVAKDKPVYVYCQSGNRSAQAAALLKKAGYINVIDLGAMSDVQALSASDKS